MTFVELLGIVLVWGVSAGLVWYMFLRQAKKIEELKWDLSYDKSELAGVKVDVVKHVNCFVRTEVQAMMERKLDQLIAPEKFIDEVVHRIKRKQLKT